MRFPYQQMQDDQPDSAQEASAEQGSPRVARENYQGRRNPVDYDTQAPSDVWYDGAASGDSGSEQQRRHYNTDDVMVLPIGNIQSDDEELDANTPMICPPKQLLPYWPYYLGLFEVIFGFLALSFAAVEIFIVPLSMVWGLNTHNSYGAEMWSAIMLILSGSVAMRACKTKSIVTIVQFYLVSSFTWLFNTAMLVLTLYCVTSIQQAKIMDYPWVRLLAILWCIFGYVPVSVVAIKYFRPVVFGHVKLLRACQMCWCHCLIDKVPSQASSVQSVSSDSQAMCLVI